MKLFWTSTARIDRHVIYDYIEAESPSAARDLDAVFVNKTTLLTDNPHVGRLGRRTGTRELVVHPNYIVVYDVVPDMVRILRIIHAAQQWP